MNLFILLGIWCLAPLLFMLNGYFSPLQALAVSAVGGVMTLVILRFGLPFYMFNSPHGYGTMVYRSGRPVRWVGSGERVLLCSWLDVPGVPLDLMPQAIRLHIGPVSTHDGYPIHYQWAVEYQAHPYAFPVAVREQWLSGKRAMWNLAVQESVHRITQSMTQCHRLNQLSSDNGKGRIVEAIRCELASMLDSLGFALVTLNLLTMDAIIRLQSHWSAEGRMPWHRDTRYNPYFDNDISEVPWSQIPPLQYRRSSLSPGYDTS